eukprot:7391795-Prymnesium_polylepis.1
MDCLRRSREDESCILLVPVVPRHPCVRLVNTHPRDLQHSGRMVYCGGEVDCTWDHTRVRARGSFAARISAGHRPLCAHS